MLARGVPASPGAAKGEIVFTAPEAVEAAAAGRDVILVRPFTEADDVAGFHAARGILTSEGGKASHAALVARGMGRPCVCGASELEIDLAAETRAAWATRSLQRGDRIAIDGSAGHRHARRRPARRGRAGASEFETVLALVRRAAPARRARQRRHARGRRAGARVRRRGDRPLPHRAHVHGGRPPAEDARDDHGRRTRRRGAPRSPSCCRCSSRTSRACSRRWRASRSRSACSTRRCTSSCRTASRSSAQLEHARDRRRATTGRAGAHAGARAGAGGDQPDARHARLPPGDPLPGDLRDAGGRDRRRRRSRCASGPARRRCWR